MSELLRRNRATGDSLVWCDGFVDWMPLRAVNELGPLLVAVAGARSDGASQSPPEAGESRGAEGVTSNHPLHALGDVSTARGLSDDAGADSAIVQDLELLGIKRRRAPSATALGPWMAVAAATVFGLTIGYVVFSKNATAVERKTPESSVSAVSCCLPHPAQAAIADVDSRGPERTAFEEPPLAESERVAPRAAGISGKNRAPVAIQERSAPLETQSEGLAELRGLTGARASGPGGSDSSPKAGPALGVPLEASDIQLTVGRYKSSVKRGCWEPASSTRAPGAPSSARVEVTVDIAPSGRVLSVASSGDPRGYRGLARCIEGRVRGWQFPASGGETTTRIPFVFATQ